MLPTLLLAGCSLGQRTWGRRFACWLFVLGFLAAIGCSTAEGPLDPQPQDAKHPVPVGSVQDTAYATEEAPPAGLKRPDPTSPPPLSIIEIPRPNSGTYSDEEAKALLPTVLARAAAVSRDDPIVTGWQNPFLGFRVHVSASGKIETTSNAVMTGGFADGIGGVRSALNSCETLQQGNSLGILLSSDTPGWDSAAKRTVIDVLFKPSIQLYLVAGAEADPAESTEQ